MTRLPLIDANAAQPKAAELLGGVQAALGVTPNMTKVLANSPASLAAWVHFNGAAGSGVLSAAIRERIALQVAQENGCDYCLSVHSYLATNVAGITEAEVGQARDGKSDDPKAAAALALAGEVVQTRGAVDDSSLSAARAAGLTDEEIVEVVTNVALNFFTNFVNRFAQTEIDFPVVRHA